jgi:hypothetical protein
MVTRQDTIKDRKDAKVTKGKTLTGTLFFAVFAVFAFFAIFALPIARK